MKGHWEMILLKDVIQAAQNAGFETPDIVVNYLFYCKNLSDKER